MANPKAYIRTRNLFDPSSKRAFKLSRSRLESFIKCPRCFYLDRRLGVDTPGIPAFTLNSAVDALLKKEFDGYRTRKQPHPIMLRYKLDLIPFAHSMMDEWRDTFKGVQYHHKKTNLIIFGAVDDLWTDKKGILYVVDYKTTSTKNAISLDTQYAQDYKRQMEIYQWLLIKSGFSVSDTGYFLYCNADRSRSEFGEKLEFKVEIITYKGNTDWVEPKIIEAHKCLMAEVPPTASVDCEYCRYRKAIRQVEGKMPDGSQLSGELQGELFK